MPAKNTVSATGELKGKCPSCKADNVILKDVSGLFICERCSTKRFSNKVRKTIQEAFDRQEESRKRDAWVKRLEFARKGTQYYEEGKYADALKKFRDFISILESRYRISPGTLSVHLFDKRKDAGEIILIAGIYWDMAKIYDHMKGHGPDMRVCLAKFIEFSIDRPHIVLASEGIRRYLAAGKSVHTEDLKAAHQLLQKHMVKCFIATSLYGPQSEEVRLLRGFRDRWLAGNVPGRAAIATYYRVSPSIAMFLAKRPRVAKVVGSALRPVAKSFGRFSN